MRVLTIIIHAAPILENIYYCVLFSFHFIWWESLDSNSSLCTKFTKRKTVFASLLKVSYPRRGTVNCFYAGGPIYCEYSWTIAIMTFRPIHPKSRDQGTSSHQPSVIKGFPGLVTKDREGGSEWHLMIFLDWDKQKYLQFSIVWDVRKETEWWEFERGRRILIISLVWIQSLNIDPLHPFHSNL